MAVKLFLNSQAIMNHVFPLISKNAYDATEVDKFLDVIIQDYRLVETNVLILKKEYDSLKEKNRALENEKRNIQIELEKYKAKFANIKSAEGVTIDNLEYVQRIGALEKYLWAHGVNPDTIK